eukprot:gene12977-17402_t
MISISLILSLTFSLVISSTLYFPSVMHQHPNEKLSLFNLNILSNNTNVDSKTDSIFASVCDNQVISYILDKALTANSSVISSIRIRNMVIDESITSKLLSVSNNLTIFDISCCLKSDYDTTRQLSNIISKSKSLRSLILDGYSLANSDMRIIAHSLRNHPTLESISLASSLDHSSVSSISSSSKTMDNNPLQSFTFILKSNKNITNINLSHNNIKYDSFKQMNIDILQKGLCKQLRQLDLSYNPIGDNGLNLLINAIEDGNLPHLEVLVLKEIGASIDTITRLFQSIPKNYPLKSIDVSVVTKKESKSYEKISKKSSKKKQQPIIINTKIQKSIVSKKQNNNNNNNKSSLSLKKRHELRIARLSMKRFGLSLLSFIENCLSNLTQIGLVKTGLHDRFLDELYELIDEKMKLYNNIIIYENNNNSKSKNVKNNYYNNHKNNINRVEELLSIHDPRDPSVVLHHHNFTSSNNAEELSSYDSTSKISKTIMSESDNNVKIKIETNNNNNNLDDTNNSGLMDEFISP